MSKKGKGEADPIKAGPPASRSYFTSYPIFCAGTDGQGLLITGGGGGGKSYGVLNFLQAHVVIQDPSSRLVSIETIATLDTGSDAPMALDFLKPQGGIWACALGTHCMIFKFNDDTLQIEPLFRWKSELSGDELHITNFVKMTALNGSISLLTGGEDKTARLWQMRQETGPGSRISEISLVTELADHKAEVVDGDWQSGGQHFLTCGKDGSVRVYASFNQQLVCTLQPRSIDKKMANENAPLAIRSAYFVGNSDVAVLCHHPRGPAFLMLFSLANPVTPVAAIVVSKSITPSMGINQTRDRIVVSHAGGEKDVFAVPSLRKLFSMTQHSHEMPPGKSFFVFDDLVASASPDFSLNVFDPYAKRTRGFLSMLFWLIVLVLLISAAVFFLYPQGREIMVHHLPALKHLQRDEL